MWLALTSQDIGIPSVMGLRLLLYSSGVDEAFARVECSFEWTWFLLDLCCFCHQEDLLHAIIDHRL